MPLYAYKAINHLGKEFRGERLAKDTEELRQTLKSEELLMVSAEEGGGEEGGQNIWNKMEGSFQRMFGVSLFDKLIFTKNLSVMIRSGLSLTRALSAIAEEMKNENFKGIILEVSEEVTKGKQFAEALEKYRDTFGDFFIHMVGAGEASGKLDRVLLMLARQMKKDYDLRSRVRSAMIYPAIIIIVLCIIGVLMMIYVVPTLAAALKDLNVELPLPTKIIIFLSDFLVQYILLAVVCIAIVGYAFLRFIKSPSGKPLWDTVVLRVPIFGDLIKKMNTARVTRVLAYLLASGVPITKSLEISAAVVGNTKYRNSVTELSKDVVQGRSMGSFFHNRSDIYDPLVAEMVSAGEETGKIPNMLIQIALFFEEDITETTQNLSSIIEPILMVFIGGVVAFFALSVLQPIYGSLSGI